MSENIVLFCSHHITAEELAEVICQSEGVLTPDGPWLGRISYENCHVWISSIDCYDGVVTDEDFDDLERTIALLGEEFRSCVSIDISRTSGSQRLAVRFAHTCCQHWPCVVDNLVGRLFSKEEIAQLYHDGGGFTTYGL